MSIQSIYVRLVQAGMSPVAACAMLGNMQAESAMRADNVQNGMGYTDADYTAAVDAGAIDFVSDQRGYGLCQWTYPARKRNLLHFARSRGVSIGDEKMQVDFCIKELQTEYASLWRYLTTATGVYEAAGRICREYERPAVNNVDARAGFANQFYMSLGSMDVSQPCSPDNSPTGEPEDAIFHTPAGEASQSALLTAGGELPQSGKRSHPGVPPEGEPSYWPPRVLAYGMFGGDVVALQGLLTAHGSFVPVSSQFDNKTRAMVLAFQAEKGLDTDGIVGERTWTALLRREPA